jgi:hypothetical protein
MKKIAVVGSIMMITLMSCVTSLHPLVTYNTAITDDRITGVWTEKGQEYRVQKFFSSEFFQLNKEDLEKERKENNGKLTEKSKRDSLLFSRSYMIRYIKDGLRYDLFGNMIRLDGQLFINFLSVDMNTIHEKDEEIELPNRLETGTIARVQFKNANTIKLDFINGEYVYDQIKSGRMKIKNERDDLYDTFLITASTNELQQFIQKYGNDDRFYKKEKSVTLNRKS